MCVEEEDNDNTRIEKEKTKKRTNKRIRLIISFYLIILLRVLGGSDRDGGGGRCIHSNPCPRVKAAYSIRRKGSGCGSGGGSGGGTLAHSLWEMRQRSSTGGG